MAVVVSSVVVIVIGRDASLTAISPAAGPTTIASRTYTHQAAPGTRRRSEETPPHQPEAGVTTTYGYDGLQRLTTATLHRCRHQAWSYDSNGNRLSATTGASSTYAAHNGANELCFTATSSSGTCTSPPTGASIDSYDTTGNQSADPTISTSNTLNVFNQLTATTTGGTPTSYSYADTSNTERQTAGPTNFVNAILGTTQQTTAGTTASFIRDPYGNLIAMQTGGASYYYTTDALGSVIALTNPADTAAATYTYDPWGNTTSNGTMAATNPWRYTGGYQDPSGYLKLGARYYNPTTARFTQPDPSGQETNTHLQLRRRQPHQQHRPHRSSERWRNSTDHRSCRDRIRDGRDRARCRCWASRIERRCDSCAECCRIRRRCSRHGFGPVSLGVMLTAG